MSNSLTAFLIFLMCLILAGFFALFFLQGMQHVADQCQMLGKFSDNADVVYTCQKESGK